MGVRLSRGGGHYARYYGRGEELLRRYGWFTKNADDCARAVGTLRPNELGLFDMLGNAQEWCEEPEPGQMSDPKDDVGNAQAVSINERSKVFRRGGSFLSQAVNMRERVTAAPTSRGLTNHTCGFRPARTLSY